jgi:5-deoxy-5-amino-3-dehydroquinate synthase
VSGIEATPAGPEGSVIVPVALGERSYEIVVGPGVVGRVGDAIGGRRRVAVVSQAVVAEHHGPIALAALADRGVAAELFVIGDGEPAKTLATVESLCRRFAAWGLLRGDAVVALGGGVVGDTAGFAASIYHRGVAVVQVPTTLLAQVDAAIGGKTAVNLPEGKNLLGAFHQPSAVLADTATLATLPEREYRAGLGEIAKYAFLDGAPEPPGDLAELLVRDAALIDARDETALVTIVARCAAMKAAVVAADEHERLGLRAVLNYGHTLAHAIESLVEYDVLHGEAVAIGMVFAGALARALGRVDAPWLARQQAVLDALHLPVAAPAGLGRADLIAVMKRDKKSEGGLTFVLPGSGSVTRVDDPPAAALDAAFAAVGVE